MGVVLYTWLKSLFSTLLMMLIICLVSLMVCHCSTKYEQNQKDEKFCSCVNDGGGIADAFAAREEIVAAKTTDKYDGVFGGIADKRGKRVKRTAAVEELALFGRGFDERSRPPPLLPCADDGLALLMRNEASPARCRPYSDVIQFPGALMESPVDPVMSELLTGKRASRVVVRVWFDRRIRAEF